MLVVIAIIALLIGLLFPALRALIRNQRRAATTKLMQEISLALSQYLAKYPMLGDHAVADPHDFTNDPWLYLYRRPLETGETPYMQLDRKHLARFVSTDTYERAGDRDGEVILDAFSSSDLNSMRLRWTVQVPNPTPARPYATAVAMYSFAGTPGDSTDDLILRLDVDTGRWTWYRAEPDPAGGSDDPIYGRSQIYTPR